jgi:hypothetical protein
MRTVASTVSAESPNCQADLTTFADVRRRPKRPVSGGLTALPDGGEQARTKIDLSQLQPELQPEIRVVSEP